MVKLYLEPKHKKLVRGATVQLKPCHMSGSGMSVKPVDLKLSPKMEKAIAKAMRASKGYRLRLSPAEIEGSGIKEAFEKFKVGAKRGLEGVKKGYELYKEHVVPVAGPAIRKGLKGAAKAGLAALAVAQPELVPAIALLESQSDRIVDAIGDKTGAYGMCGGAMKQQRTHYAPEWDTYSSLIGPNHPAMHPPRSELPAMGELVIHHYHHHPGPSGSFKAVGSGRGGSFRM